MVSVRRDALKYLIIGNFTAAVKAGQDHIHMYAREYERQSNQQSSIYQSSLVDQKGLAPTMYEVKELVLELRAYEPWKA